VNLTFAALRRANLARDREMWGALDPDRMDWSPEEYLTAVVAELGEFAHLLKDKNMGSGRAPLRDFEDELADTAIFLDLLAASIGVDLEAAILRKWNEVSARVGSAQRLAP